MAMVTSGVYGLVRHPSYTGWFIWSISTQAGGSMGTPKDSFFQILEQKRLKFDYTTIRFDSFGVAYLFRQYYCRDTSDVRKQICIGPVNLPLNELTNGSSGDSRINKPPMTYTF
ncbi:unnamed protein product [Clavelina lepadiformis]|uniref:Protein-S-isoprenylcysteine O-methyltransferase n=1 Tax=Clavelina lepadiformis TaxID=159417 RepID=A0ABP0FHD4_CLALP